MVENAASSLEDLVAVSFSYTRANERAAARYIGPIGLSCAIRDSTMETRLASSPRVSPARVGARDREMWPKDSHALP